MITRDNIKSTWDYIRRDHASWPGRFYVEVVAWSISIGCSLTMMLTVPNPPLIPLYFAWVTGCAMYAWAAWTRGSFGMLANYFAMMTIDAIALIRMLTS